MKLSCSSRFSGPVAEALLEMKSFKDKDRIRISARQCFRKKKNKTTPVYRPKL